MVLLAVTVEVVTVLLGVPTLVLAVLEVTLELEDDDGVTALLDDTVQSGNK